MSDPKSSGDARDASAAPPRPDERPVPRNAPPPAAGRNYRLNCSLGPYDPGQVVPGYVVEVGHDVATLLDRGLVERTDAPATVNVRPPAVSAAAPPGDVFEERNRLARELDRVTNDAKSLEGKVKELEGHRDSYKGQLAEHVESVGHLTRACDEHQQAREALEAENAKLREKVEAVKQEATQLKAELEAAPAPHKKPK